MNEEEGFQVALDASPNDWTTRLIFADWLEERGDVRAEGYRALGNRKRVAAPATWPGYTSPQNRTDTRYSDSTLPLDWFLLLTQKNSEGAVVVGAYWRQYINRRKAEDAAALAFSKLPPKRRSELLETPCYI